jgi:hypothetical protein
MIGRLSAAARGAKNVASSGADEALKHMPLSNNKGFGRVSAGNPAGYNASKSTYIQNTKSGYQARPHNQNMLNPPRPTNINLPPRSGSTTSQIFNFKKPDHSRVRPDLSRFS